MKNRQFKFRVWNGENLIYIPYCVENGYVDWLARNGKYNIKTKYILQQFTGIIDKNRKEIYEGDIVKCSAGQGAVKYDDNYGAFRILFSDIHHKTFYQVENYEIIGNIFENPELLK